MAATAAARYKKLKTQLAAAKREMKKTAKTTFKEQAAVVFTKNPEIVSFSWAQYTPYWNDGDTCTFSANTEYPTLTFKAKDGKVVKYDENMGELTEVGTAVMEDDVELAEDQQLDTEAYDKEYKKYSKAVINFLQGFEEDDLETMFGDHVEITVTPKKVTVDDYEHE